MSSKSFQSLMRRMEGFEQAYARTPIPERRRAIKTLYCGLRREFEGEAKIGVKEVRGSVTVRMVAKDEVLACDEADSLLRLLSLANLVSIRRVGRQIRMDMWFRYWEWKKKEQK